MNMYGIMTPAEEIESHDRLSVLDRVRRFVLEQRKFMLVVVLPVVLVAGYYYLIAADQYVSESHFTVRTADNNQATIGSFGQMLGLGGGSSSQANSASVADYLTSHDVVDQLQKRLNLVAMFRRPEADPLSRLGTDHPTPERLLRFFRKQVDVKIDSETGLTTLVVRGFRRDDAYVLNRALLELGEERVNQMNLRSYNDAVRMARLQLAEAETNAAQIQGNITRYRQTRRDIDPQGSGEAQIKLVTELQQSLSAGRAQLEAMGTLISHSSPQYVALQARVRSLAAEIAAQNAKLAGGAAAPGGQGDTIATSLGGFEDLKVRQDFASKRYEMAAGNLEKARSDAQRQQLYIVRVVDANMPVKSLYPHRLRIVATVTFVLLLVYGIGWLLVAGVREHAA